MTIMNPAPAATNPVGDRRVQPDGPLSGEVQRGGMSAEDREEIAHERWVLSGGPDKMATEHAVLAGGSLVEEIQYAGWTVLSSEMIRPPMTEVMVCEAVIRRADTVHLIRWNTFNKGWMKKGIGWTIFSPLGVS